MKKALILLLVIVLLILNCSISVADVDFDISEYLKEQDVLTVDVDTENDVAFIKTKIPVSDLAFAHKYESDYSYSFMQNDIIVLHYFSSSRFPAFRTWIYYTAEKPQYFYSVSFDFEGVRYTFSDVGDKDRVVLSNNNEYTEGLLITYGENNTDFYNAILKAGADYVPKKYTQQENSNTIAPKMKMILHGLEDVEVDVPDAFWTDMLLLALPILKDNIWYFVKENDGTPCKMTR